MRSSVPASLYPTICEQRHIRDEVLVRISALVLPAFLARPKSSTAFAEFVGGFWGRQRLQVLLGNLEVDN